MASSTSPTSPELSSLRRALQRANGDENFDVIGWDATALTPGAGSATGGIQRYTVMLAGNRSVETQTLILKVLKPGSPDADPTSWNYWKREPSLYASGLLANLPDGLAAPACYGTEDKADGSVWLWLEDIDESDTTPWTIDRFALAARHLGRLNGRYLVDGPLPDAPWLSRHTLASWISGNLAQINRAPDAREDPIVGPCFDSTIASEALRLKTDHVDILDALDRLPQTFHHGDAHRGNMISRVRNDGHVETVLFDWAFTGIRAVGEELESFVSAASMFFHIPHEDIGRLSEASFEGYLDGLRDESWRGDPNLARLGYLGAAALRYTLLPIEAYFMDDGTRDWFCGVTGRPFDETMRRYQDVRRWGFQQESKARELMRRLL